MMPRLAIPVFLLALCLALAAPEQEADDLIRLPLRVHLVTGIEMVREIAPPGADPVRTVMDMPVRTEDMQAIIGQVNAIWEPAGIRWETDPAQGGGGIVTERAGGGKLSRERLQELAGRVVARSREAEGDCMKTVFPALADPAQNDALRADGTLGKTAAAIYHLYVFPYVGQTLQGTARCPGTFAVVGAFSDKSPNKPGYPKLRPFVVPGAALLAENFPAAGALSATIAHELGHNLALTHENDGMPDNLMKGHVKLRLSARQIEVARQQAMTGPRLPAD